MDDPTFVYQVTRNTDEKTMGIFANVGDARDYCSRQLPIRVRTSPQECFMEGNEEDGVRFHEVWNGYVIRGFRLVTDYTPPSEKQEMAIKRISDYMNAEEAWQRQAEKIFLEDE